MKPSFRPLLTALAFCLCVSLYSQTVSPEVLPPKMRTNGGGPALALKDRLDMGRLVTVRFQEGRKNLAFGTIVDSSGLILAKLSDVGEIPKLYAVLADGSRLLAVIKARDTATDLALVKVEATDPLSFVTFDGKIEAPEMGTMLYAFNSARTNLRVGVISARPREIKKPGGVMGILMGSSDDDGGVLIEEVVPESGADAGGLKGGDVLLSVNGEKVDSRQEVTKLVSVHGEGETLLLQIRRGDDEKEVKVKLGEREKLFGKEDGAEIFNGKVSVRRKGFARIIQHDLPLEPEAMGGPLWDLDGNVIGLNIARVERVATYALPASLVRESLDRMKVEAAGVGSAK